MIKKLIKWIEVKRNERYAKEINEFAKRNGCSKQFAKMLIEHPWMD